MNKIKLIILSISFLCVRGYGQEWIYTRDFNSTNATSIWGMDIDNDDNMYIGGRLKDDMELDTGLVATKVAGSNTSMFIVSYDDKGDYKWHTLYGDNSSGKTRSQSLVVDRTNNIVYATGDFQQLLTSGTGTDIIAPYVEGKYDAFITAVNEADGSHIRSKRVAWGPDNVQPVFIGQAPNGEIILLGFSQDTIFLDGQTLTTSDGKVQNFIATFDANLNLLNVTQITSSSTAKNNNKLQDIDISPEGDIYVCGVFQDTLFVGGDTITAPNTGSDEMTLIKFDSDYNYQWGIRNGGPGDDRANGLGIDLENNIYVTGFITDNATFDVDTSGNISTPVATAGGSQDMFVAKYNKSGKLLWKSTNGDAGIDVGAGAYVYENTVQFTGSISGEVIFNADTLKTGATSNQDIGFFVYDTDGYPILGKSIPGSDEDDGKYISYDNRGNTFIAAAINSATISIGDSTHINSSGKNIAFIARYSNEFSATFTDIQTPSCSNVDDGMLTVTPFFGAAPYTYTWSTGFTGDSSLTALDSGTYQVTVTDRLSNTATTYYTVTQPDTLEVSLLPTNTSCYQTLDGEIDITVSGGTVTSAYTYSWSGGDGLVIDAADQVGLAASNFNVTVTDDNDCSVSGAVEITEPDAYSFSSSVVDNVFPSGSANGSVIAKITGGTGEYNYQWLKGLTDLGINNDTIENLEAAAYTLNITDENACPGDTTFVVPDAAVLQINKYKKNISCFGGNNGWAAVDIITREPGVTYSYEWQDSLTGLSLGTDTIISAVIAGKYYISVTGDDGLNTTTVYDSITISQPQPIVASFSPKGVKCYGDTNGSITMSINGGTYPYEYNWSTGDITQSIANYITGKYYVTITDANGCEKTDSSTIETPDSLSADIIVFQQIRCNNDANGVLQAVTSGGTGAITRLWDPGSQSAEYLTGLSADFYTLTIADENGCSAEDTVTLINPDTLHIEIVDTSNVSCFSSSDGRVEIATTGGTPTQFLWSHPSGTNSNVIENLVALDIPIMVTVNYNEGFCSTIKDLNFTVQKPAEELTFSENMDSHIDNLCFGDSIGEFEITATGGWEGYEYSIDGIDYEPSATFTELKAGDYNIYVRDAGGCIESQLRLVAIEENSEVTATPIIIGNTVTLIPSGGEGPYLYVMDGGDPQTSAQFNDVPEGPHTFQIYDNNGCTGGFTPVDEAIADINLTAFPNPVMDDLTIIIDNNLKNQSIELINFIGQIVHQDNTSNYSSNEISINMRNLPSGIYFLRVEGKTINEKIVKH